MIPKPINEITWSDIEALKADEREEDDMLEYKEAFSVDDNGAETLHYDYAALNKNQRKKANASIAKHAIAFLNGRGGDLLLGVRELSKENPVIDAFTPIHNIVETRDRLERAMAEVIEPRQTALSIKAVISPEDINVGVLVIRANSSLRAPHRSTISKDCYVRRGRESVPMPMDEVQDLTIRRDLSRSEIFKRLDQRIANYHSMLGHVLPKGHIHISFGLVSYQNTEIIVDANILREIDRYDVKLKDSSGNIASVPYDHLPQRIWKPIPRGHFVTCDHKFGTDDCPGFVYKQREIHRDGMFVAHIAESGVKKIEQAKEFFCVTPEEFVHRMADTLGFFQNAFRLFPTLLPAAFRVKITVTGQLVLNPDHGYYYPIIEGEFALLDWEIQSAADFSKIYKNIRTDIYNAASIEPPGLSELV